MERCIAAWRDHAGLLDEGFLKATLEDAVYRAQKLSGQLRNANEIARETTVQGRVAVEEREKARPWQLRFGGIRATLQANLRWDSMAFRHAIRLAVCVLVSEVIVASTHMVRPFWIPMTVVLVLRPEFTLTTSRSILRIAGTIVGLVISTAMLSYLPETPYTSLALITLFTFGLRWLGPSHYGILSLCVSGQVVVLLSMLYPDLPAHQLVVARALNTLYGGSIALLAYWLWPTREKALVNDLLAALLERYRDYAKGFLFGASPRQVDALRLASRQTRGRFRASCDRFFVEAGTTDEQRAELSAMMASSNRVAHALIGIETVRLPELTLYRAFADELDATLAGLAQSLRTGQLEVDHHIKLRELHTRMQEKSEASSFLEETDRLTNSLGTLSEQIARRLRKEKRPAISHEPSSN